jgi:glycosyltransferase involved in cell wall biosynthesis
MGTKRSIYEEVKAQGHNVRWLDKIQIPHILDLISKYNPDQIWLAHSNLRLPMELKKQIQIPVIGFGFSDPYYFSPDRFIGYDVYVTNHKETFKKYKDKLPCIYNATACDFRFHAYTPLRPKVYDVSILGLANHPRFTNKLERLELIDEIRKTFPAFRIEAFGRGWPKHSNNHSAISGEEFKLAIQQSILGLDIQDDWSPLAHRMFEYAACGVPVITRNRPEVFDFFEDGKEILSYDSNLDLMFKLEHYLNHQEELISIGDAAWKRCKLEHNINFRVSHILSELERIF